MPKVRQLTVPGSQPICLESTQIRGIIFTDGSVIRQQPGYWTLATLDSDGRHQFVRYQDYEIVPFATAKDAIYALEVLRTDPSNLEYITVHEA